MHVSVPALLAFLALSSACQSTPPATAAERRAQEQDGAWLEEGGQKRARDLPAGHTIRREDLAIKSPGDGLHPYEIDKVIGRVTRQAIKEDDDISIEVLNGSERWAEAATS